MLVKILQLKDMKNCKYSFSDYSSAKNNGFSLNDYESKYEMVVGKEYENMTTMGALDEIYSQFNMSRPSDFTGHSISMSDVIKLDNQYYYVDMFGFTKVGEM